MSAKTPQAQDSAPSSEATAPATPRNELAVGDCLKQMAAWDADSVDLIFADPPYNIGYSYDQYDDKREDEDYIQWTCDWIDGCSRLLKPSGSMYILIGDEYAAETRLHLKKLQPAANCCFATGSSGITRSGSAARRSSTARTRTCFIAWAVARCHRCASV